MARLTARDDVGVGGLMVVAVVIGELLKRDTEFGVAGEWTNCDP